MYYVAIGTSYYPVNSVNNNKSAAYNLSDTPDRSASNNRDYFAFSAELRNARNRKAQTVSAQTSDPEIAESQVPDTQNPNTQFPNAQAPGTQAPDSQSHTVGTNANTDSSKTEQKTLAEMMVEQMDKIDNMFSKYKEYDKSKDTKLNSILHKFNTGVTLTAAEQQYLALKDPDTYSSYQKINTVRGMYKCSLGACSTRDQVNSMRLCNSLSALAEYKKAIRKGGDGADIIRLNAALENEIKSYVKAGNYQRLPTAAECNKFDADIAKARKYEREKQLEKRLERLDPTGKKRKKKYKIPGDGKRTVAQVMNSPLGRKVLASRRKSGCCSCGPAVNLSPKLNFKI